MSHDESKISQALRQRQSEGSLRTLTNLGSDLIDFTSNDYLGLSRNVHLNKEIKNSSSHISIKNGSTGSRLLTGNSPILTQVEKALATIFEVEQTLLFNAGYMANLAFFSAVPQKDDLILHDAYIHASIKDGCRLSLAKKSAFRHNDLSHLEQKLKNHPPNSDVFVVVESVYSMDGDHAPLLSLSKLCKSYNAKLIVDEAHSTGLWGINGGGLVNELNLNDDVYAKIMTFGKAMGVHGACICGSEILIHYLQNFARPFIYTTAISEHEAIMIQTAFHFLSEHKDLQSNLFDNIQHYKEALKIANQAQINDAPIQVIQAPGNENARALSDFLKLNGIDARPILSPTVQKGQERIRICLHLFNTKSEITHLCKLLNTYFTNLEEVS